MCTHTVCTNKECNADDQTVWGVMDVTMYITLGEIIMVNYTLII